MEIVEKKYKLGKLFAIYHIIDGLVTLSLLPEGEENNIIEDRITRKFLEKYGKRNVDCLVELVLAGDGYLRNFSAGQTQSYSDTTFSLKFLNQRYIDNSEKEIITFLQNDKGVNVEHHLKYKSNINAVEMYSVVKNLGNTDVEIEKISSGKISNISAYTKKTDYKNIFIHRLKNNWSQEARLESNSALSFGFDDNWAVLGTKVESFGTLGTMPALGYLPFISIEDKNSNITFVAEFETPASWQIEIQNENNMIGVSGGYADFRSGHWSKKLNHGESFTTFHSFFTAVYGDLLKGCNEITDYLQSSINYSNNDRNIPILYNEYCYTWGHPSMKVIPPIIDICKNNKVDYVIIDAGWFDGEGWSTVGDWNVKKESMPNGLIEFTDSVRNSGMKAGIWFEFEAVSVNSIVYKQHPDWLLTYKNKIITHEDRCFLDFRKKEVIEYLKVKVINLLKDNNFDYVKVDYNENIGFGIDGKESYGENLRQHILGVISFFKLIRKEIPDITIEICSSGGMRHEPLFLSLGTMCSFSDAHEGPEGARIAMSLHRYMPVRNIQIWATIKPEYNEAYAKYTLIKSMLGRMCLSGNISDLNSNIKKIILQAINIYKSITDIIKLGKTIYIDCADYKPLDNFKGSVSLVRESRDSSILVYYAFSIGDIGHKFSYNLSSKFKIVDYFGTEIPVIKDNNLEIQSINKDYSANIVVCKDKNK